MNEYEFLSPSEQLSAFLDGELEPAEANKLFTELAHNTDLQSEMQDMIGLRTGMMQLQAAPPQKVKDNLIASLGLGAIGGTAVGALSKGIWQSIIVGKPIAMLLTGLLAAVTTLFVVDYNRQNMLHAPLLEDNPAPYAASFLEQSPNAQEPTANQQIKVVYTNKPPIIRSIEKPIYIYATVPQVDRERTDYASDYDGNANSIIIPNEILLSLPGKHSYQLRENNIYFENYSKPEIDNLIAEFSKPEFWQDISLQFRMHSQAARSYPNPNVYSLANPTLNNVGFALLYLIDSDNSIGIELGQENFLQVYNGKEFGLAVTYEQNYLGFWIGATYRNTLKPIGFLLNTQPLMQITLGGTNQGPLAKALLGLQYNFQDKIFVFGGLDAGTMLYKYQSKFFTSNKIGFSYGVAVRF